MDVGPRSTETSNCINTDNIDSPSVISNTTASNTAATDAEADTAQTPSTSITTATFATTVTTESKAPTRSSARVRAAKEKERELLNESAPATSSSASRKGKGKEIVPEEPKKISQRRRKTTQNPSQALTINEPSTSKGKKRAQPESDEADEVEVPPAKKLRSSTRSKKTSTESKMPKKSRATTKGKAVAQPKTKASAGPSKVLEDDIEMMDPSLDSDGDGEGEGDMDISDSRGLVDDEENDDDDEQGDDDGDEGESIGAHGHVLGSGGIPDGEDRFGMSEADARGVLGMLGGDFHPMGALLANISTRLKSILVNISKGSDPTLRVIALQELSELLSVSNEETLHSFSVDAFVRELVKIMGGTGKYVDEDGDDDDENEEGAARAEEALFLGEDGMGDIPEAQVLACRCLANLMEAIPGSAHTIVYHGAVPVLCSKLVMITDIDLAEQTLSTLEKISEEYPSAIVRDGGLGALLNMLDFFPTPVQRIALHAAANCCRNIPADSFRMVSDAMNIIRNVLGYSDQRLVEYAGLCVIRVIESYHRSSPDLLDTLLDDKLIRAIGDLLLPPGTTSLITSSTYTLFLRALATAAKASPKVAIALLKADIVQILYQILTGVLPPTISRAREEQEGQGLLADMAVMENLAHRPKEQVEEALSLISELMPALPKDGVFDAKAYTEKGLAKFIKAKAKAEKAERARERAAAAAASINASLDMVASSANDSARTSGDEGQTPSQVPSESPLVLPAEVAASQDVASASASPAPTPIKVEPAVSRIELLHSIPEVVDRFMDLIVPILVDVYAASVITNVRVRALSSLLKAVSFLDGDGLKRTLASVPIPSFIGSILSLKDHSNLVIAALQLVELLLAKGTSEYRTSFKREGVLHAIETIAEQKLVSSKSKEAEAAAPADGTASTIPSASSSIAKRGSSSIDPQDLITIRARVIRLKYLMSPSETPDDDALGTLQALVASLSNKAISEAEIKTSLQGVAALFSSPSSALSSFELKESGLVETLLDFATSENYTVSMTDRRTQLWEVLSEAQPVLSLLVKRLQESLTRTESFEVTTVSPGYDDSKHRSASMLARSLRLRLAADDGSEIPASVSSMSVSIQAIATFQALNDYLRPRIAGLMNSSAAPAARLSAMLAMADSRYPGLSDTLSPSTKAVLERVRASSSASTPAAKTPEAGTSNTAEPPKNTRRRSKRLSHKQPSPAEPEPEAGAEAEETAPVVAEAPSAVFPGGDDEMMEDDFEPEVVEEADEELPEKTVNVAPAADGSKVEAQTPHGTRVATPNPKDAASTSSAPRASYATALKAKPTDWHLEFSMDGHALPLDMTIYGAIHQHELRKGNTGGTIYPSSIWSGIYTINFKKVTGPAPSADAKEDNPESLAGPLSLSPSSLPQDTPTLRILRLLRVLYALNTNAREQNPSISADAVMPENAFINNKLSAKLTRQLEETMIVASSCLPDWAIDLPLHFPFLFPFGTRFSFLQSTSFGYARLILKWQSQQARSTDHSRRDDGFGYLGRLQRQKVRISRKYILESAVKVFDLYGSSSSVLEVEYFEEVGTGLGPTLEFYSLVSQEFARRDLKIWRDADSTYPGQYVSHPTGLFPAPLGPSEPSESGHQRRLHLFQVIGQFVAKALLDSRIVDMSFNKVFLKHVLGEELALSLNDLRLVDPTLANSLSKLVSKGDTPEEQQAFDDLLESLALDFTIPGYDIELKPNGRNIQVTSENVDEYLHEVLDALIGKGIRAQAQAFRVGFSKVFPISDMQIFSVEELATLLGNSQEDWSLEVLNDVVKADHGFNMDSRPIHDLMEIMSEFDDVGRREYLQFITGSPKLPIGGFRGLNPPFTVVRKPHEAPLVADDYLPSVMTCVNYLKLPEYSSKAVMREKLRVAVKEGVHSGFHLS
ncbi:hypothetical protein SISSUDRAFT_1062304 [Sistotremastrum suecicum HHB10207 ss-3]|uniref:HECT-type E3 ubiquitin transferase n=1 Tax=Sistotremastrum suecicum HHB10207 ss-3 TaxID=1314776 RepID=A0A166D3M7_9AGAM|nr:hypothetical protein SISSUDRAFT_1062304 [Sistotremastrum suecicum HHB10207 ss-3]